MLGMKSTCRVASNDAMEFVTNWQVAILPMFLMMGSFAAAAGISNDIYRVANALLGRIKGGLANATFFDCAGFGAVSGSSVADLFKIVLLVAFPAIALWLPSTMNQRRPVQLAISSNSFAIRASSCAKSEKHAV